MDSASKPLEMKYMRGMLSDEPMGDQKSGSKLRGVERNTARGVKMPVQILNVIKLEHANSADAPEVIPFDTYGDDE